MPPLNGTIPACLGAIGGVGVWRVSCRQGSYRPHDFGIINLIEVFRAVSLGEYPGVLVRHFNKARADPSGGTPVIGARPMQSSAPHPMRDSPPYDRYLYTYIYIYVYSGMEHVCPFANRIWGLILACLHLTEKNGMARNDIYRISLTF